MEKATFGAGCFWGVEARFQQVPGVVETAVGYEGGALEKPTYKDVCTDRTGHAEVVEVTFDPARVEYRTLVELFFRMHNPTTRNRQGPDVGMSYRSAIFPQSAQQAAVAKAFIARLNAAHRYKAPIATRIENGGFFPAEAYHQGFARKHPYYPYIVVNDRPKVEALKKEFPSLYKA